MVDHPNVQLRRVTNVPDCKRAPSVMLNAIGPQRIRAMGR